MHVVSHSCEIVITENNFDVQGSPSSLKSRVGATSGRLEAKLETGAIS